MNIIRLSLFLSVLFLISCSQKEFADGTDDTGTNTILLSNEEYLSLVWHDFQNLSEKEAGIMVKDLVGIVSAHTPGATTDVGINLISTEEITLSGSTVGTRSNRQDVIPIYNFETKANGENGFVIVSADARYPGVLAYIPHGDFDALAEQGNPMMMIDLSKRCLLTRVKHIAQCVDSLYDKTLAKVQSNFPTEHITPDNVLNYVTTEGDGSTVYRSSATKSPVYENPTTSLVYKEGPFATTKWHQDAPFSLALPQAYHYTPGFGNVPGNCPAGCAVIALAQTLAYIKPAMTINGLNIDWAKLTVTDEIEGDIYLGINTEQKRIATTLIKDMYSGTGSYTNLDTAAQYGPYDDHNIPIIKSTSTPLSGLLNYMNQYAKCEAFSGDGFISDPMLEGLKGKHVSIMGGTSQYNTNHAWVIDGFSICQKSTREIIRQYDLYYHANMGFEGGSYTGYYKVDPGVKISFDGVFGHNYSKNYWVIADIHAR